MDSDTKSKVLPLKFECQNRYLQARLSKPIRLRLLDGKVITGTLLSFDIYTMVLQVSSDSTILVQKHGVSYIADGVPAEAAKVMQRKERE